MHTFSLQTRLYSGPGSLAALQRFSHQHIWIVCDGFLARSPLLDRLRAALPASNRVSVFSDITPDPTIHTVAKGIAQMQALRPQVVIGFGGGSAMDCAKGIAIATGYTGDAWDFWSKKATVEHCLPIATVVTIPASGSEASNSCVISNDAEGLKSGCNSELIRPKIAFLDPELTFTLPPYQTAAGVTDMIAHIMERFFSGEPAVGATDNIACGLIRAAIDAARIVMDEPESYDARAELMWIGTLAHNGLAGCGLGILGMRDGDWSCHGMEHEVSAVDPRITHGAGLAVIFPAWMRHVWKSHPERFLTFGAEVFGIEPIDPEVDDLSDIDEEITPERAVHDAVEATIDELQDFFVSMGMPSTLGELGIAEDDIDQMICGLRVNRGESFGTFRKLTLEDAREIYESAL
mgnify:CR=1 FL=1